MREPPKISIIDDPNFFMGQGPTSQQNAKDLFGGKDSLDGILNEVREQLGLEYVEGSLNKLIDKGSINGNGGHLTIDFRSNEDGEQDIKKYHMKLVLDNHGITDDYKFNEIAYYLMYQNFGYGPKVSVAIFKSSMILILEDANNILADGSLSSFSDWKHIKSADTDGLKQIPEEFKEVFSRISTTGQISESKEDLFAIEILTLILATGDIFNKPDNYGVRVVKTKSQEEKMMPIVVDLLPSPHKSYISFFANIGASRYCDNFNDPNKIANLIADLMLKSFDPENDQRAVNAIDDFYIFEFFKGDNRSGTIEDLKGGLQKIFANFEKKINDAFDASLAYLNKYFDSGGSFKNLSKSDVENLINQKRQFILDVGQSLQDHIEIKEVLEGKWIPGKHPQTGGKVTKSAAQSRQRYASEEFFPSPTQPREVLRPSELGKRFREGGIKGEDGVGGGEKMLQVLKMLDNGDECSSKFPLR